MTGQVPAESGADGSTVSVCAGYLAPDCADLGLPFWVLGHALAGLCLVDVNTTFANVEAAVFLPAGAIDLR